MKLIHWLSVVSSITLLSSILGYFRDASLAAKFGATTVTDAYFAALFVPNTLYFILMGGSVCAVFIPIFIDCRGKDNLEVWRITSSVLNISALVLAVVVLISILTVRFWIPILFPGYQEDVIRLSIELSILLLPMLFFISLSTLLSAILNSFEQFTVPAFAPVISNLIVILSILFSEYIGGIKGIAISVLIGTLVQTLIQLPLVFKVGFRYFLAADLRNPVLLRLGKLSLPIILYLVVAYSSLAIERVIASTLTEGTVSALNYATRLFILPSAIFVGSLGTVIYPRLSLHAANKDGDALGENLSKAISGSIFVLTPISFWVLLNSRTLVTLLYGYGKFSADDVRLTGDILCGYTIGLMPVGVAGILQRGFYAVQDTIRPLQIEIVNVVFYTLVAICLSSLFGPWGLGIARGLSFIIVAGISFWAMGKYHGILLIRKKILLILARYLLACICATAIWALFPLISLVAPFEMASECFHLLVIGGLGIIGLAIYIGIVVHFGSDEAQMLKNVWISVMRRVSTIRGVINS